MKCPRCATRLQRVRYQQINVHCCGNCTGILIAQDRLSRLGVSTQKSVLELMNDWEVKQLLPPIEKPRCPECRIVMTAGKSMGGVAVDHQECRVCKLIWLDPGDIEIFQLAYLISKKGTEAAMFRERYEQLPEDRRLALETKLLREGGSA